MNDAHSDQDQVRCEESNSGWQTATADRHVFVRLGKEFKGMASNLAGRARFTGEIDQIHWSRYQAVVLGIQSIVERLLKIPPGTITAQPQLEEGDAHFTAGFVVALPRSISVEEQDRFDVAGLAFNQGLRDQDRSLSADLFQNLDPEMVALGLVAADEVRRVVPGFTLPTPIKIVCGASPNSITITQKIGRHPDGEQDMVGKTLEGNIDAVDKGRSRIVLLGQSRHTPETGSSAEAGNSTTKAGRRKPKGKRISIQFDPSLHDKTILCRYMTSDTRLRVEVSVKKRGRAEFLWIKTIVPNIPAS